VASIVLTRQAREELRTLMYVEDEDRVVVIGFRDGRSGNSVMSGGA
jgi:hypothetical protein